MSMKRSHFFVLVFGYLFNVYNHMILVQTDHFSCLDLLALFFSLFHSTVLKSYIFVVVLDLCWLLLLLL